MFWRWNYFTFAEVFRAKVVNTEEVSYEVLRNIEKTLDAVTELRIAIGHPIIINSFFRDREHNKTIGGVKNSYHIKGLAVDVRVEDLSMDQIATYAKPYFNGIIIYKTWVHVDLRDGFYYEDKR